MLCDDKALNSAIQYVWPVRCVARGDVSLVCVSRPVVAGRRGGPRAGPPMDPGRVPRRVPVRRTLLFILFLLSADSLSVSITLSSLTLFVCVWFQRRWRGPGRASRIQRARVYNSPHPWYRLSVGVPREVGCRALVVCTRLTYFHSSVLRPAPAERDLSQSNCLPTSVHEPVTSLS